MSRKIKFLICGLFAIAVSFNAVPFQPRAAAQSQIDFKRDIEPIFAQNCYQCHGAKKALGQLRLDVRGLAMKGGISGPSILPGNSKASRLMQRILGEGDEVQMPMGGDPLKPEQIDLIRKWIDEGANWPEAGATEKGEIPQHWAYIKPRRPQLPQVKNKGWVRNPIDAFILARLEREGLQPSPEADRATLLRRVYLDLTGLPPSLKEIDAFLADKSQDAYEKVVDRLLASPAYGERWARPWLDLARYADSNGYEADHPRVMWKYRDWVINALNGDMPFDQFTIEQIAGDMLPGAKIEQRIATGFHRNTMVNMEGGIDPEENRFEILVDRVNTTATVWLGSTIACAQCHNHKYDPFSQKDYYRLMAFFDNAEYKIEGSTHSRHVYEPQLSLPTPAQAAKRKVMEEELKGLEEKLKKQTPELDGEQAKWEREQNNEKQGWTLLDPLELASTGGAMMKELGDGSVLVSGAKAEQDVYIVTARTELNGITGLRLEAIPDDSLPKGGPGRDPYGNFFLTGIEVMAAPPNGPAARAVKFVNAIVDDAAYGVADEEFFGSEAVNVATDHPPGWFVNATNDQTRMSRQGVFIPEKPFGFEGGTILTIKLKHLGGALNQGIGRFRLSVTANAEPARIVSIPARMRQILAIPAASRTKKQREDLAGQFRAVTPLLKYERERIAQLRNDMKALGIVTALVMQERDSPDPPSTFLRERGSFLNKGEKVSAATPAVLNSVPENAPINRLGLARWLVDEDNPLTARVTVNRFWEQVFGNGIVETSEDFGTQGERPTHPELLDWLAVEFMQPTWDAGDGATGRRGDGATGRLGDGETGGRGDWGTGRQGDRATGKQGDGKMERGGETENHRPVASSPRRPVALSPSRKWSMKRLIRLIVTSSAYRQSSATNPALLEKDPYNRLLARGPRFRMEAEMIRDLSLAASGLLSRKIGGPSVFPHQPEGIWNNPYSSEKWILSKGGDRYRRGLYTFVRRSSPYPAMMTFDATSREYCTVRRVRTNTPLQALTMLNDEAAMEAARALASRMLTEGGARIEARIIYGLRSCVARMPDEKEVGRLVELYKQQVNYFRSHMAEAAKIKGDLKASAENEHAELAAWTMVANVLLNLDETLTKG
jgi:mono/diheme cytochrome c family protein